MAIDFIVTNRGSDTEAVCVQLRMTGLHFVMYAYVGKSSMLIFLL